jgi:hypothetical protein
VLWRIRLVEPGGFRLTWRVATAALAAATVIFVAIGPLQHGWARRAGTPTSLVGSSRPAATAGIGRDATQPRDPSALPANRPQTVTPGGGAG